MGTCRPSLYFGQPRARWWRCASRAATSIFQSVPRRTWGMPWSRIACRSVGHETPTYSAASWPESHTVGAGRARRCSSDSRARARLAGLLATGAVMIVPVPSGAMKSTAHTFEFEGSALVRWPLDLCRRGATSAASPRGRARTGGPPAGDRVYGAGVSSRTGALLDQGRPTSSPTVSKRSPPPSGRRQNVRHCVFHLVTPSAGASDRRVSTPFHGPRLRPASPP